ncbi:uncharacterized protein RJT20DRAFT_123635 [Scheffersomyces xylosifermentans]|uniref:uncharacterized protein n=1 Tax=Scheffersomyces xylosifermentans TaxID=1304137 RepID=UPI00315D8BF5
MYFQALASALAIAVASQALQSFRLLRHLKHFFFLSSLFTLSSLFLSLTVPFSFMSHTLPRSGNRLRPTVI